AFAAAALMTACSKDETVSKAVEKQQAIGFGKAFIENSTRAIDEASITTGSIADFLVYGTVSDGTNVTNIFNGVKVQKAAIEGGIGTTGTWYYDSQYVQYWYADMAYKFAAVKNGTVAVDDNDMPKTISYTADQSDLLYAEAAVEKAVANQAPVGFTFNHLLSKVKFTAVNGYAPAEDVEIAVSNVKITNPDASGVYTIAEKKWEATEGTVALEFGNVVADDKVADASRFAPRAELESNYERLIIPNNKEYTITFSVVAYKGKSQVVLWKKDYTSTVAIPFAAGYAYDLNATISGELNPIMFKVDAVEEWDPYEYDHPQTPVQ
ncbi:MAG: fimbrillin family protein, partial [Rikenellaceae bacterium]|nr:fimbrillin family protein [Rikenellaceae bacterium]